MSDTPTLLAICAERDAAEGEARRLRWEIEQIDRATKVAKHELEWYLHEAEQHREVAEIRLRRYLGLEDS